MKLQQLNPQQLANAKLIDAEMVRIGLTNLFLRAGTLAVVSKECGFIPKHEISYKFTPIAQIRRVFGPVFRGKSDAFIFELKKDDRQFFNYIYNGRNGNRPGTDDGYLLRGAGFNQITGRTAFTNCGNALKMDLVNHPELLRHPEIAAKALAFYYRYGIVSAQRKFVFYAWYKIWTTNQIKTIAMGASIAHAVNSGFSMRPENDPTGGYLITKADAESYLQLVTNVIKHIK